MSENPKGANQPKKGSDPKEIKRSAPPDETRIEEEERARQAARNQADPEEGE
jgi:hypothetical protein